MTITQIIQLARRKILEATEEIFTDTTLVLYANIRKDEIAQRFLGNRLVKPSTLSFTNGVATKPTDWNGHYFSSSSDQPRQGYEFKLVNISDFQNGTYPYMITESEGNILVFPTSTATVYTWYYKKLTDMALTPAIVNPPSEISDAFHKAMMYGVVSDAFEDAQDFELSKFYTDKFEAEFEKASMTVSQLEESSQEAGALLSPLPDLNFSGSSGGGSDDPNRW